MPKRRRRCQTKRCCLFTRTIFWHFVALEVSSVWARPFIHVEPDTTFIENYVHHYSNSLDKEPEFGDPEETLELGEPEVVPGLFEGDIAGLTPELFVRLGINWQLFPDRKWDNLTVPYSISYKYLPDERQVIETAIAALNFFTCVRFVPWNGRDSDYLLIWPMTKPKGCWSFVGRIGGQQVVSLQRPDDQSLRCLGTVGKPMHELLHSLGTFHEQARPDRDDHISIQTANIHQDRIHNFGKQSDQNVTYPFPYDYDSVMHYGSHYFSRDRKKATIVPKKGGAQIGQRVMISKGDCLKINHLYGCFARDTFESEKYRVFCNYLAL